jgi:hypothetical protein
MVMKLVSVLGDDVTGTECGTELFVKAITPTTVFAGGLPIQAGDILHPLTSSTNTPHLHTPPGAPVPCSNFHTPILALIGSILTVRVEGMSIGTDGDSYAGCTGTLQQSLQGTVFANR